jgi:glutaredoxin-dependent peroxiredoxin
MRIPIVFMICFIAPILMYAGDESQDSLRVGDQAPAFSLPFATKDSIGRADVTLTSLLGKGSIVLAFYPADFSGGCTKEVCTLRDNFEALGNLHASVYGISGDYIFSHHEWANKLQLPFTLLSDHDHRIARLYKSYMEDAGYNKRTVYVIDKGGKISYCDLNYSVRDSKSFDNLKAALDRLK